MVTQQRVFEVGAGGLRIPHFNGNERRRRIFLYRLAALYSAECSMSGLAREIGTSTNSIYGWIGGITIPPDKAARIEALTHGTVCRADLDTVYGPASALFLSRDEHTVFTDNGVGVSDAGDAG